MDNELSFEMVLTQLRQRDDDAATEVYKRFAGRLIALARRKLDPRILQRVDPDDVVQSVFKSVFLRLADGQFVLGDWDSFWGLLTRVTMHKCHKWVDYYEAQSRQINREVFAAPGDNSALADWQFLDREPTPPEAAMLVETIDQVLLGLEERERQIVMLSLQGHDVAEVSAQVRCTEAKVYRVLRLIRQRLDRMRDPDS